MSVFRKLNFVKKFENIKSGDLIFYNGTEKTVYSNINLSVDSALDYLSINDWFIVIRELYVPNYYYNSRSFSVLTKKGIGRLFICRDEMEGGCYEFSEGL